MPDWFLFGGAALDSAAEIELTRTRSTRRFVDSNTSKRRRSCSTISPG
jgi:hypothetical protein